MNFSGFPFPIKKTSKGLLSSLKGLDKIRANLMCILLTNPGERCMLPDFGTPLRSLIFEPNDEVLAEKAKDVIISSIKIWEPRVVINAIDVSASYEEDQFKENSREHVLYIKIMFSDPENISEIQELKLELPLSTGNV